MGFIRNLKRFENRFMIIKSHKGDKIDRLKKLTNSLNRLELFRNGRARNFRSFLFKKRTNLFGAIDVIKENDPM